MNFFEWGLFRLLCLPVVLIIELAMLVIDFIRMLGGKRWNYLEDHLYIKFWRYYIGD